MAQVNIDSKFTVFAMANNENIFYVMSPTQLWTKEENDNEVAAKLLGVNVKNFYEISIAYGAILKKINNYTIISFKEKEKATKFAKMLNTAYIKYRKIQFRKGVN